MDLTSYHEILLQRHQISYEVYNSSALYIINFFTKNSKIITRVSFNIVNFQYCMNSSHDYKFMHFYIFRMQDRLHEMFKHKPQTKLLRCRNYDSRCENGRQTLAIALRL